MAGLGVFASGTEELGRGQSLWRVPVLENPRLEGALGRALPPAGNSPPENTFLISRPHDESCLHHLNLVVTFLGVTIF